MRWGWREGPRGPGEAGACIGPAREERKREAADEKAETQGRMCSDKVKENWMARKAALRATRELGARRNTSSSASCALASSP